MPTFLFNDIIFGPVKSRRLGTSLGINLLPLDYKICSFDCLYCECGFNQGKKSSHNKMPSHQEVISKLDTTLKEMITKAKSPDVITFAGNGEPTLHPEFAKIIDDTIKLRDLYFSKARIAVLSNASRIHDPAIFNALLKIDDNILKLDSGKEETIQLLNRPQGKFNFQETIENLKKFKGKVTIQTLFVKANYKGTVINNSTDEEVDAWLEKIKYINPGSVMIYTIARGTPLENMEKISGKRLNEIALRVEALNIKTQVSE